MKRNFKTMLFLAVLISLGSNTSVLAHTNVSVSQAKILINSTDNLVIVDVREQYEFCGSAGHIPRALNYPWNSGVLKVRYDELPLDGPILVVCKSGGRSNQAATFLDSKGFSNVYDMLSGMSAWTGETQACKYSGGNGTSNYPYQIATVEDWQELMTTSDDWDENFIMTADIDVNGIYLIPVGISSSEPFEGSFNGDEHIIKNADVNIPDSNNIGLFGCIGINGQIDNLGLENVKINCNDFAGSLAGINSGDVNNCYSTGIISGNSKVGGLVGSNDYGIVRNCYFKGKVNGTDETGGLIGNNSGQVSFCYSSSEVTAGISVGGLIGTNNQGYVSQSYSMGTVTGLENPLFEAGIGGLIGSNRNYSLVTQSYSRCDVNGIEFVGGLIGVNEGYSNISYCYNTGTVDANGQYVAGVLGYKTTGDVNECFWDVEDSNMFDGIGNIDPEPNSVIGKTAIEMQMRSNFTDAGWDFIGEMTNGPNDIWWILEERDYPRLWWQLPEDDFNDANPEPLWFVYEMSPEDAYLEEINNRLEINTTGVMDDVDAMYVSDGWQLDANKPFEIQIDFHFSKIGNGDGHLTLGIVPSLDVPATQWAQFEVGTFDANPFYLYEVRDGEWVQEQVDTREIEDGILYMSYDPNSDELYFSDSGYGKNKAIWTVQNLIRDMWQAESIYITIGGGSEDGMVLTGDDAWLDNFKVAKGSIMQ